MQTNTNFDGMSERQEIFSLLPRFVECNGQDCIDSEPKTIEFKWREEKCLLVIHPAQVTDGDKGRFLLPGEREKNIERAILNLGQDDKKNSLEPRIVKFRESEVLAAIEAYNGEIYSAEELEESIDVISHVNYQLIMNAESFYFRSFGSVWQKEMNGELMFQIQLLPVMFDRS